MLTNTEFTQTVDGIFEANNFSKEENRASKKIIEMPGGPGTQERIEQYRKMVEQGIPLFKD